MSKCYQYIPKPLVDSSRQVVDRPTQLIYIWTNIKDISGQSASGVPDRDGEEDWMGNILVKIEL